MAEEKAEAHPSLKTLQSPPEIGELGRGDENNVQPLHNDTCELQILPRVCQLSAEEKGREGDHLLFLNDLCKRSIYLLGIHVKA